MLRAVVVAALVMARTAAAAPSVEITGTSCDEVRGELASVLHPGATGSVDARVRVAIDGDASGLRAELTFEDRDGRIRGPRIVHAIDCADLASSVAVVVAMALEDLAAVPVRSVERDIADVDIEVPAPPPKQRTAELVGGIAIAGGDRQVILGGRTMRGVGSLAVELHVDETIETRMMDGRGVDAARLEVTASPCLHLVGFGACAVASAGVVRGSAAPGLYQTRTVYGPVLGGGLRATYERWLRDRIGLRLHVEGRAFATSMTLRVDYEPVWKSKRFEAATGIAVLVRFR